MKSLINEALSAEAVTITAFKKHIKWDPADNSEDYLMNSYLVAATKQAESYTRRAISRSTWNSYLDSFSNSYFDVMPIDLTTVVVSYYNDSNVLTTLSASEYSLVDNGPDDYAQIIFDGTMPTLYDRREPVVISYTAGYAELPYELEVGIFKLAADYFEQRTNELIGTSASQVLFGSHQVWFPYKML